MKVLVFEYDLSGHGSPAVAALVAAIQSIGCEVTIATPLVEDQIQRLKRDLRELSAQVPRMVFVDYNDHGSPPRRALSGIRALRAAIKQCQPDHVYLTTGDRMIQWAGLMNMFSVSGFGSVPMEAMLHRMTCAYDLSARVKLSDRLKLLGIRHAPFDWLHFVDSMAYAWAADYDSSLKRFCSPVPFKQDAKVTLSKQDARQQLGLPQEGRYIGCVGLICGRKGCDRLIEAFARVKDDPHTRLLLSGPHDPPIRKMLEGEYAPLVAQSRIISIDRYTTADEMHASLCAMDLLAVLHVGQIGMSATVLNAASVHCPVVGSELGWMGQAIRDFGLGWTCNTTDAEDVDRVVQQAMATVDDFVFGSQAQSLLGFHTLANYGATLTHRLRQRLGMPPSPNYQSWSEVMGSSGH